MLFVAERERSLDLAQGLVRESVWSHEFKIEGKQTCCPALGAFESGRKKLGALLFDTVEGEKRANCARSGRVAEGKRLADHREGKFAADHTAIEGGGRS